jgi:6-phosphogluconolactonase
MGEFELRSFADPAGLAARVAQDWLDLILNHAKDQLFCVALPGGRLTPVLLSSFAARVKTGGVDLSSVHFFWSDERCVPPSSPESNYRLAWEHLLKPLQIPEDQIHRIQGELPSGEAASQAEAELRAICRSKPPHTPRLDLILLGMGEDGHVASLFPGEAESWLTDLSVYRPVSASKPPPLRITLGYPVIAVASCVWVLVSGAGKERALQRSLVQRDTPLGNVLNSRPVTRLYSDLS